MEEPVLFIGNDINNINNEYTWKNIINELRILVGKDADAEDIINEFPLLFENLLQIGIKEKGITEKQLKRIIAEKLINIIPNAIHHQIITMNLSHIVTTNYDLTLGNGLKMIKKSVIDEKKYSVFRNYKADNTCFWHVHGDINSPETINLGFEHYGGQLQQLRNYVVTGTNYKSTKLPKLPLVRRLFNEDFQIYSWVDLFFIHDIHIIGLRLDFVEMDLWWLLTYRGKMISNKKLPVRNSIKYYIPEEYAMQSRGKIELMNNLYINVVTIKKKASSVDYYSQILKNIPHIPPNYKLK